MLTVSHRLQYPYKKVIHNKCKRSCKIYPEIGKRFRQNFRGCSHKYQYLWRGRDANDRQDHSADHSKYNCCMD